MAYKKQHPEESFSSLSKRFQLPSSTIHDHFIGSHADKGRRAHRNLSVEQEDAIIDKINAYAERGTLLTPQHINELAAALCESPLGRNWTSTFLRRHADKVSSRFYRIQELARLSADTPENRQAFYALVSHFTAKCYRPERSHMGI